ncbi:hypothetical protein L6452_15499 [Arctium lappa]|uniref:Uncharacterized protein n=1 Tax=Arctium lappa TaxID=4217 RepID=A0ACB9CP08_ARCLA|nr:hypothetical protein L6452_15499 [Arctium lappa]
MTLLLLNKRTSLPFNSVVFKHYGNRELEDGQVKLQSRLEEEEEAKAALLSRIQRLTKLILLAYLPHRRRDISLDDENIELYFSLDGSAETNNDVLKEKKIKKPGLLSWLKLRKRDGASGALTASDKSS